MKPEDLKKLEQQVKKDQAKNPPRQNPLKIEGGFDETIKKVTRQNNE